VKNITNSTTQAVQKTPSSASRASLVNGLKNKISQSRSLAQRNIKLASHAGFCYGVKRAVETVKKLKEQNPEKEICVLGELIHNSQVIKELEDKGIKTVSEVPKVGFDICVIRSHGASFEVFEQIKNSGLELVDLTCPDVKKVQNRAIELAKEGYFLIILGKREHPEVMAIEADALAHVQNTDCIFVAPNVEALKAIEELISKQQKIGVVVQTTQRIEFLQQVLNFLIPISRELKVINTICASTSLRQNEARELACESDLMIVVGSKKSANTTHLANILEDITQTIHIETAQELEEYAATLEDARNIGVTAGASTPDYIIKEVITKIKGE